MNTVIGISRDASLEKRSSVGKKCVSSLALSRPNCVSHILMVLSLDPDANSDPSGEKATA
jgi:hypothetical protein